jgi:hypothetical protein
MRWSLIANKSIVIQERAGNAPCRPSREGRAKRNKDLAISKKKRSLVLDRLQLRQAVPTNRREIDEREIRALIRKEALVICVQPLGYGPV